MEGVHLVRKASSNQHLSLTLVKQTSVGPRSAYLSDHMVQLEEALWLDLQTYLHPHLTPVKTTGAAQQHTQNLICNKIIFFHMHLSTLEGSKTHLGILSPGGRA